jgi:hypothetical protein
MFQCGGFSRPRRDIQRVELAIAVNERARFSVGSNEAMGTLIIPLTTRSATSVNPARRRDTAFSTFRIETRIAAGVRMK